MHRIEDITIEWKFNGIGIQENMEATCNHIIQDRLLPKMELQLDTWNFKNPGMKCIIPEIQINILCTEFSVETIEYLFLQQFKSALEEKTKNTQENKNNSNKSQVLVLKSPTVKEFILAYLTKGFLTNTSEAKEIKEWSINPSKMDDDFISKTIYLISNDSNSAKRFIALFTKNEVVDELLFKKNRFYRDASFMTEFMKQITAILFPKKQLDVQLEIWKTILISSTSLERSVQTLYTILKPLVTFRYTISETKFSLSALLLQAKCQLESKKNITFEKDIKNIFIPSNTSPTNDINSTSMDVYSSNFDKEVKKREDGNSLPNVQKENIRKEKEKKKNLAKENLFPTHNIEENQTKSLKNKPDTIYEDMSLQQSINNLSMVIDTALICNNIGLFILHPFLKEFFTEAGILVSKEITNPTKGIQLLHYMATGNDECNDVTVLTEKVLLGIPIQQAVFIEPPLSNKEKSLCDNLLKAILKHWTVLEKSGIDTLRSMFLIREGTIIIKEKNIHIEVKNLAQDVLLKKLPWGLGLIRLPWVKEIFQINWKS